MLFAFALIHGLQEWSDMIKFFVGPSDTFFLIGLIAGVISFGFLLQFGINLLSVYNEKWSFFKGIPFGAVAMFFWLTFFTGNHLDVVFKNAGRFSLGFLGAALATYAIFIFYNKMKEASPKKVKTGILLLLIALGAYTLFGGLIISPIAGIPVQLFRMACALLAAIGGYLMLGVFEVKK